MHRDEATFDAVVSCQRLTVRVERPWGCDESDRVNNDLVAVLCFSAHQDGAVVLWQQVGSSW